MISQDERVFDDGGRIMLRPLREEDVDDTYLSWFQDTTVTEFLDAKRITRDDAVQYMRHGRETRLHFMYAVVAKDTGHHIGNVKIGPIQWSHLISDLVTVIGRREYWGKGYATEAIKLGNKIAFEVYGIRKLSGGIADGNVGSVKAYTSADWVIEGRLEGHHLINGEARDRIIVSCFNPKFFPARKTS
jgi:[ribosomal protein S5]-alanine N-acetyltransferase